MFFYIVRLNFIPDKLYKINEIQIMEKLIKCQMVKGSIKI